MRDDLQGLEITAKELQNLTNLPVKDELLNIIVPVGQFVKQVLGKIKGTEGATVVFISFSILVGCYIAFDFIVKLFDLWLTVPSWLVLMLLGLWLGGVTQIGLYVMWRKRSKLLKANMTHSLQILLNDVDRYNAIIKAIDINDQIEDAGNSDVSIRERERVLAALRLTRNDLVRALKTEKILRENKNFIINHSDFFADNLATLTAMQVTEQATEHGRILNEALQIALDVQHEMKKLQSQP